MDLEERAKLNLTVLRRHDPSIVGICDQSPHAVVYKFVTDKNGWDKMGVEGVLFLVHRQASPEYALVILNRLSMENFCLYVNDIVDISLNDSFVICQTSEDKTCGLWLFEEKDRQRFVNNIQQLRKKKESKGSIDILKLLEKAFIDTQPPNEHVTPKQPKQQEESKENTLLRFLQGNRPDESSIINNHSQHYPPPGPVLYGGIPPPTTGPLAHHPHPHPPPPPPMEEVGPANTNFHSNSMMLHQQQQQSSIRPPPPPPPPPAVSDHELAKSFFPAPYPASPQKRATLLQVLQGGGPPPMPSAAVHGSPQMMGQHPWPSQAIYASPLGTAPPLTPHQALELTNPEMDRRLPVEGRPVLSKPEFIQQFLNMVQNDSSFLDTLYDQYRNKQIATAAAVAPLASAKNMAPYYHQ